jgi:hypothetical protein
LLNLGFYSRGIDVKNGFSLAQPLMLILLILSTSFLVVSVSSLLDCGSDDSVGNEHAEDFTIVVLPDTQIYCERYPEIFDIQTQWIVDHVENLNIVFVTHEGDVVNWDSLYEWKNANHSLSLLDGHVAWGVLPGNHDIDCSGNDFTSFNTFFGFERFSSENWYGGGYYGSNINNFELFSNHGTNYLIFHLQHNPDDTALIWANEIISSYPGRRVIVTTHEFLWCNGVRTDVGNNIWNKFVQPHADQIFFVLCGHMHGVATRSDFINGAFVHQVLADYQDIGNGGDGWLRILRFSPSTNKIYVSTYSPYLNSYMMDWDNEFALPFDFTPSSAPTPTPEPAPTPTPEPAPTPTPEPAPTPTPEPAPTPTPEPPPTPTPEPPPTPTPEPPPTPSSSPKATASPTPKPSPSSPPSQTPTQTINPTLITAPTTSSASSQRPTFMLKLPEFQSWSNRLPFILITLIVTMVYFKKHKH